MDDLARWLGEQLDEDDRIVRAATQGDWVWSREFVTPPGYHYRTVGPLEPGDAAYIAAWNPARVLREIDAKRGIVRAYEAAVAAFNDSGPAMANYERLTGSVSSLRGSIELLATAYSDRPGFREEWRP